MSGNYKKLTRSKDKKMICGVCAGIGEYLSIDPTIIRIIWIVLSFTSVGMAVLAYFIVAVVIPDEDDSIVEVKDTENDGHAGM